MKRLIFILALSVILASCSNKNKTNTTYTIIIDHYSTEIEETLIKTLSITDYSPCPNLATSTYKSKLIRYDIEGRNESKIIRKSLVQSIFPSPVKPTVFTKKLSHYIIPNFLKSQTNNNVDPKDLELYINSFDVNTTKIMGINSLGIEYKNLHLNQAVNHFQNIYDLKDALSDYICNEINEKNVLILLNVFNDTSLEDCLKRCESLAENSVCADDGNIYHNIECLKCYSDLNEISCIKSIPTFKRELLTEKAFEIFYQFTEAQKLIANDNNATISNDLIDNTLRLFHSENTKIEILNLGTREPIQFSARDYLKRMMKRPFDRIDIEWNQDWTVMNDWTDAGSEIPESEMTARGRQSFKGYRKNLVAYSDAIDKNVNFQAKLVESIDANGNEVLEWKVFIGNITIASEPSNLY
ncbi:MAG: hypothetical protein V3V00_01950 [Saprospiraceae bacterium]